MSRAEVIEYATARTFRCPSPSASPLQHRREPVVAIDRVRRARRSMGRAARQIYTLTRSPQECPDEPAYVEIDFEAGIPVRTNGIDMPLLELIESVETIAGAHGVGRIDMVENRLAGIKSREVYEAPAAVVLYAAHRELESLVIARDLERIKHDLARTYADLVYTGRWFSQTREAISTMCRRHPAPRHRVSGRSFSRALPGVGRNRVCAPRRGLVMDPRARKWIAAATRRFIKGPATLHVGLPASVGADVMGTSGPDGSTATRMPRCSSSALRSPSIAASFRTTCGEASHGRLRSRRRECCRRPTRQRSAPVSRSSKRAAESLDSSRPNRPGTTRMFSLRRARMTARIGDAGRRLNTGR